MDNSGMCRLQQAFHVDIASQMDREVSTYVDDSCHVTT
jgi:hypothetical protein